MPDIERRKLDHKLILVITVIKDDELYVRVTKLGKLKAS